MLCYIDGNNRTSDMFWKEVQVLLSPDQRRRLLDGYKVHVGGRDYCVITDEMMEEMAKKKKEEEKKKEEKKKSIR